MQQFYRFEFDKLSWKYSVDTNPSYNIKVDGNIMWAIIFLRKSGGESRAIGFVTNYVAILY